MNPWTALTIGWFFLLGAVTAWWFLRYDSDLIERIELPNGNHLNVPYFLAVLRRTNRAGLDGLNVVGAKVRTDDRGAHYISITHQQTAARPEADGGESQ